MKEMGHNAAHIFPYVYGCVSLGEYIKLLVLQANNW